MTIKPPDIFMRKSTLSNIPPAAPGWMAKHSIHNMPSEGESFLLQIKTVLLKRIFKIWIRASPPKLL